MENLFQRPREVRVDDDHLAKMRKGAKERLCPYKAPEWAEKLRGKPTSKINLCQKDTPIQRWYLPDIPDDFEIYIKREDMSGSTLAGHKIRKLEFHLADALQKNCKSIIGIGSAESNSCRTLAVAGRELGFHVHLVQYTEKNTFPLNCNIFLSQMAGAHIHLMQVDDVIKTMKQAFKIPDDIKYVDKGKLHQPFYILPLYPRGDGEDGFYGYIDTFQELVSQGVTKHFTDVVLTSGSSLSTAAFIIGNYMTGSKLRLHTLSIRCSKEECKNLITNLLRNYGFLDIVDSHVDFEDLISIVEESREPKYGQFYDEHVDFVRFTAASTGIFLDPVYTGKTANHMVKMIRTSPNSFKGKKILFYNTGGPKVQVGMEELFQQPMQLFVSDDHLASMRSNAKGRICPYKPPLWAEKLKEIPSSKVDVRKLEFHLADALEKEYTTLVAVGSSGSNYCRTVAVAGKELGFHVHLMQYSEKEKFPCNCNILISQMAGAHIHIVKVDEITDPMKKEVKLPDDLVKIGQTAYMLPINPGSDGDTGIYAYIDTFQELMSQGVTEKFTDLVLTCGSTSATVAFIIGNYMNGGKLRLHGLSVRCSKEEYEVIIMNLLKKYGFLDIIDIQVNFEDLINIEEESRNPKYGKFYAEHVDFVRLAAASTGIFLDPVYTGKTANHMVKMIRTSPNSFKGKKILYYNTGSVFGTLNEELLDKIKDKNGPNTVNYTLNT
ncbi:Bifunctional D-cysteine desulfhydrase/1-aminocyclopropane-1-carboxylate deaminase, mitochondrial [Holothuria leucospilota]|uniref:Bifunctional D-cysteine desulfhydrase/1-aminocyclopropane-1-carboxylate deaminase, mitochondrial n=1 Tax=Holothuria leucospilota TaxID=206669 RepID=A0A9Q1BQB9_HOLLE|nr:Bifunctional D-cysteine desulfhydrase/1-aminocyclopropane-1-carboxylate deaminase, mitochondrial [Holothuria leucospilota]